MSAIAQDGRTVGVLIRRDLRLFVRQRSRIAGALAQPLLLWLAIGAGIAPAFRMAGDDRVGYMTFFFPGVVVLLLLQNAISATMSVIEDRHQGFLQGVLVAPGSRAAVVLGKCLGATAVSAIQAAMFLVLAPLAGFPYAAIAWAPLALVIALTALAFTALGFAIAWWLDSTTGYHVVMSLVLFPLWVLSGAVFPPHGLHPIMAAILRVNPVTYAVAGLRRAMHDGLLPPGSGLSGSGPVLELAVLGAAAAAMVALAVWVSARRPAAG